jgi:hypothetical protein
LLLVLLRLLRRRQQRQLWRRRRWRRWLLPALHIPCIAGRFFMEDYTWHRSPRTPRGPRGVNVARNVRLGSARSAPHVFLDGQLLAVDDGFQLGQGCVYGTDLLLWLLGRRRHRRLLMFKLALL